MYPLFVFYCNTHYCILSIQDRVVDSAFNYPNGTFFKGKNMYKDLTVKDELEQD